MSVVVVSDIASKGLASALDLRGTPLSCCFLVTSIPQSCLWSEKGKQGKENPAQPVVRAALLPTQGPTLVKFKFLALMFIVISSW